MNGVRGYIALSEKVAVSAGGTYQLPLKLNKGIRGPGILSCAHVTKLHLVFDNVSIATAGFGADTIVDSTFLSTLIQTISVYASQDSPLGARKGGQLVKDMSGYLALTTLSRMTDAPMLNFGAETRYVMPSATAGSDPSPQNMNASTSTPRVKSLNGRFHTQGPWGYLANGSNFTSKRVTFTLPIGERCGEDGNMNPIPLGFLNGYGSQCGCSKSEGLINLTLASSASGFVPTFTNVQVFAEVIYLPNWHFPLQPWVFSYQTTDTVINLDPGISGFRALAEDVTAGGAHQLTNVASVTQYKLTVDGFELYSSQYPEARAAWVSGNTVNGPDSTYNTDADPDAVADLYTGSFALDRYSNPWFPIITHQGPTNNAPDFGDGRCRRVAFELVNASAAVNRRVLQGLWIPHDSDYIGACERYAGVTELTPRVPFGALSPNAVARGTIVGIPLTAKPSAVTK